MNAVDTNVLIYYLDQNEATNQANPMNRSAPSALVTDKGKRVHLRLRGRLFELSQEEVRKLLGMPPGAAGLGISIEGNRFCFEFADEHERRISAKTLYDRLAKQYSA